MAQECVAYPGPGNGLYEVHAVICSTETELKHALPPIQIRLMGEGSTLGASERQVYTETSQRMIHAKHIQLTEEDGIQLLEIILRDPETGIEVHCLYRTSADIPIILSATIVENKGSKDIYLETVALSMLKHRRAYSA
ncbi:hypothetical protein PFICI_06237 [Pestalotiopsis fici W106-1]|uniref:Uncharacterized protein n=1 Tax=Pestalotiopsis fici (strain W106-1 / CGMCC3.15140) TaxID=1229662 RepID=W3X5C1_PESFW|nr:uncharacterized protein PFICI_06237 [Pestalotiopsis fici W106-1]ETS81235.1 hypothetical protein PFICI_06237 [Pestalotiopsis fici W106-1]